MFVTYPPLHFFLEEKTTVVYFIEPGKKQPKTKLVLVEEKNCNFIINVHNPYFNIHVVVEQQKMHSHCPPLNS
jgi:hypothetical protein